MLQSSAPNAAPREPLSPRKDAKDCVEPHPDHHCWSLCASGKSGLRVTTLDSTVPPLRPPFHSLTRTPLSMITGLFPKSESGSFPFSPHNVTSMLVAVSSATVMSRFNNSRPSLAMTVARGLNCVTIPQRLTRQGVGFDLTASRSVKVMMVWLEPLCDHQSEMRFASGTSGRKVTVLDSMVLPLRSPFHSFRSSALMPTTGFPSKSESGSFALSPHKVTSMLVAVSSTKVMSRFTSSRPSFAVTVVTAPNCVMTPHTSTRQGTCLALAACKSVKLNTTLKLSVSPADSAIWASRSKTSS
mmetsp:Transcript_27141/g.75676  ORF Transcript_27141/g.75676 Transcript_27141/m.75676 type:complete len:299 (-) Transcript_27141:65-961(-)